MVFVQIAAAEDAAHDKFQTLMKNSVYTAQASLVL